MSNDRDRRRPIGPPPGIPSPDEFAAEENTGQHVRVALVTLNDKMDEAIRIDRADHKVMTDTLGDHTRSIRHLAGEVTQLKLQSTRIEGDVKAVSGKMDVVGTTLTTMNGSIEQLGRQAYVRAQSAAELDTHEKKLAAADRADKRKNWRDLGFKALGVFATAAATWVLVHYTGCH